jgi:hypothetical protein
MRSWVWSLSFALVPSALRIDERESGRVDVDWMHRRTGERRMERGAHRSDDAMLGSGVRWDVLGDVSEV